MRDIYCTLATQARGVLTSAAVSLTLIACNQPSKAHTTAPHEPVTSQSADTTPPTPMDKEDDTSVTPKEEDTRVAHSDAGNAASVAAAAHGGSGRAGAGGEGGQSGQGSTPVRTASRDGDAGADAGGTAAADGAAGSMAGPMLAPDGLPAVEGFPEIKAEMFGTPKLIASSFDLAEGPLWDPCEERLMFSDVNTRRIYTHVPGGEVTVYMERTNYVNGMIFDPEGRLLLAEMGGGYGGRITRMSRDKQIEVLIDRAPNGSRLRTSDDLTLHRDGTIYFSDPEITHGSFVSLSTAPSPFYRLSPGPTGMRNIVKEGQGRGTNGIRLTRDMNTLLISEYSGGNIAKYSVHADGSVEDAGDLITGLTKPDSMCLDLVGNLYIGVSTGIQVVRPDGTKVALLRVGSNTTNCAFGGPDGKTMFITAWTKLLSVENMPVPGLAWAQDKLMKCD